MHSIKSPNFQELLDQYRVDTKFEKIIDTIVVTEDEIVHIVLSKKGVFLIFETDYISDLEYCRKLIEKSSKTKIKFIEVKEPKNNFNEYPQLKYSLIHKEPEDFDHLRKYLGYKGGSEKYYFSLLARVNYSKLDRLKEFLFGKK